MKLITILAKASLLLTLSMNTFAQTSASLPEESVCTKSIDRQSLEAVLSSCSSSTLNHMSQINRKINADISNINRQILAIEERIAQGEEIHETLTVKTSTEFLIVALGTGLSGTIVGANGLSKAGIKVSVANSQQQLEAVEAAERNVKTAKRVYGTVTGLGVAALIYVIYELNERAEGVQSLNFQKSQIYNLKNQLATMQRSLSIVDSAKLIIEAKAK